LDRLHAHHVGVAQHIGVPADRGDLASRLARYWRVYTSAEARSFRGDAPGELAHADTVNSFLTPVLYEYLARRKVTALVAPCDYDGRYLYGWLLLAGYRPGLDLSLVSFDNAWAAQQFPVSSVDFGFELLGYKAFHLIYGDVPVRKTGSGEVSAEAFVTERGSIGTPARGRLV
jgi:DNA-binding LacI/PurR family transcriptional regulator